MSSLIVILLTMFATSLAYKSYQKLFIKVPFETYDFTNSSICCAECDISGTKCRLIPDKLGFCTVELTRPERLVESMVARAYRAVPLDHRYPDRLMMAWLAEPRSSQTPARLGMRFMDFSTCQSTREPEHIIQDDEEFMLSFIYGTADGPIRYELIVEEHRSCGRPKCQATLIKEFSPSYSLPHTMKNRKTEL